MQGGIFAIDAVARRCLDELFAVAHADGDGLELRGGGPGDRMVVAYTDYTRLAFHCGLGQPWLRVGTANLVRDADDERVRWVAVDVPLPEGHRYPVPGRHDEVPLEPAQHLPGADAQCWVASLPVRRTDREVHPELVRHSSQRQTPLVYSSVETLQRCCGPHQAAFQMRAEFVDDLAAECGATEVAFDRVVDPSIRHQSDVIR